MDKAQKPKKILLIGPTPPPYNGMSVVFANLLNSSLCHNFRVLVLDIADRRKLSTSARFDFKNVYIAVHNFIRFLIICITQQPSIVYTSIAQNYLGFARDLLFLVPANLLDIPVVIHLHGSHFQKFYKNMWLPLRMFTKAVLSRVRAAIVLNESLVHLFDGIIDRNRVFVVDNGVCEVCDSSSIDSKTEAKLNTPLKVLYFSNLIAHKGFLDVIRAANLVKGLFPNTKFDLVGEKCYQSEIIEAYHLISSFQLEENVFMPGTMIGADKKQAFWDADVFVFPPITSEGQPLVILEAMSAGLPIIATSKGAIASTIEDNVTGFIVPSEAPEIIAEKIILLIRNRDLLVSMGKAARKRYLSKYRVDQFIDRMSNVFNTILSQH